MRGIEGAHCQNKGRFRQKGERELIQNLSVQSALINPQAQFSEGRQREQQIVWNGQDPGQTGSAQAVGQGLTEKESGVYSAGSEESKGY